MVDFPAFGNPMIPQENPKSNLPNAILVILFFHSFVGHYTGKNWEKQGEVPVAEHKLTFKKEGANMIKRSNARLRGLET